MSSNSASQPGTAVSHRGLITLSTMLATIMQVLDTTIANVALPSMQGSLGAAQDTITWVLTSYIVSSAILTPATGWLSTRFGLKRLFLFSVGGFTLFSMLCGATNSLAGMVIFRVLQGVFGAALVPLSQTVLLDINPRERHGQAMAMWGAGIMVGPIIGPTLGGWLTQTLNWRWVFYINLPIGLLAFLGILAFLPEREKSRPSFDFFGFTMLSVAIGALQLMLDRGEQLDWFSSKEIIVETALAIGGFWMFAVHVATAKAPFIPARLFRDRNLAVSLIFIFLIGIVLLASLSLLPPLLQRLMGYPVITAGIVMGPRGIGTMASMLIVGRLVRVIDPRILITVGLGLAAWSLWMMSGFSLEMGWMPIVTSGVIQGFGLGLVFVPLSTVAFSTLDPSERTDATSLYSLIRNIGSSVGISVASTLLTQNTQINHALLGAAINPSRLPLDSYLEKLATLGSGGDPRLGWAAIDLVVNAQAAVMAYLTDFQVMMVITLVAAPIVLLLRPVKAAKGSAPPVIEEA